MGLNMGEIQSKLLLVHSCCSNQAARSSSVLKSPTHQVSPCCGGFPESLLRRAPRSLRPPVVRKTPPVPLARLLTCTLRCSASWQVCSPLVVSLCRAQLLEEEEEIPGRYPLCQLGLLFQGEQLARDGRNPRRRTEGQSLELRGRERRRGRDMVSTRGSREPGVVSAPLLAKRSAARSETSSSSCGVAMSCKSPEQAQLYLPSPLSIRHRSGGEES